MNNVMIISLLIFSAMITGCAQPKNQPAEQERVVAIVAEKYINPNKYNHAAPLSLFIYQLKATENFQEQDDEIFFLPDARKTMSFSQDVIAMKELIVKPGEKREVRFPRQPDEAGFGVIAAFRELDNADWKCEFFFPKDKAQPWYRSFFSLPESKVTVHIKKLSIEAKVTE